MKRKLLLMMASLLLAGAVSAQTTNFWENNPDSHAQPSNTPIVASVQIDGQDVTATDAMRLGAFVGNELRGIAAKHNDGKFWIQVFYTAQTDNIFFKFYNGTTEYATCATTLAGNDAGYGTPNAPQVLNFTTTQTQTTALASGWNWWSTPIEMSNIDGLTLLENQLGNNGISIKNQDQTVTNWYPTLGYDYWWGDNITLRNEDGYKIQVTNACNVVMTGRFTTPGSHPIVLSNGWNLIGYPTNAVVNIVNALSGFTPSSSDVLKCQDWTSTYWSGYGWFPTEGCNLIPGQGYMYKSNASDGVTLTFSNSNSRTSDIVYNNKPLRWQNNVHKFSDNLSVIAVVVLDDQEQKNGDFELAAFVDGESRGSAILNYFEPLDRWFAVLTVGGQKDDQIEFRLVNTKNELSYLDSQENISFVSDAVIGSLSEPFQIHFGQTNSMLSIFPNPISCGESFRIELPKDEDVYRVIVSDGTGSIIRNETGALDNTISGFSSSGFYLIEVVTKSGGIYHGKLIVK